MLSPHQHWTGPRRLDVHQAAKVQDKTLKVYQRAVLPFVQFLRRRGYSPASAEEYDDLLVEWKNAETVRRSDFCTALAAVEFYFPRFKGDLAWAHAVGKGWGIADSIRHTVPLTRGPAHLEQLLL